MRESSASGWSDLQAPEPAGAGASLVAGRVADAVLGAAVRAPNGPHVASAVRGVLEDRKASDARHTAGQRVPDVTGNLKAVQKLLGHESIQTTGDIYTD